MGRGAQALSLKQQTFSAVRWTTVSMVGRAALGFVQIAILARFLAPADFGLMALVMAVLAFAQIFSDLGVSNAIIHRQEITQEELSSLYWLNVCSGLGLMLLLMAVSPWVASFYGEPRLQPIVMLASTVFFIVALGQQLRVVAEKNLRFADLARVELWAAVIGFTVAVGVAVAGGGVYALAVGMIANAIAATGLAWYLLAQDWRPGMRLRLGETRQFLGFGAYMMGNNLANTFNSQADILIGGRLIAASALGMYSLPRDLSLRVAQVINPIVTRVGLPVMAKAQANPALLKSVYLKTLRMTASVNFPLYLAMAAFAPEVVALVFGAQWAEAAPLLRVLAIWGALRASGNPAGSLIFAVGRADLAFKWNAALLVVIPPALWFGAHYGAMGLALSLLVMAVSFSIPGWWVLIRPLCGAGFKEYYAQLIVPLTAASVATFAALAAAFPLSTPILRLVVGLVVGGLVYLVVSHFFNREWLDSVKELLRHPVPKNNDSQPRVV